MPPLPTGKVKNKGQEVPPEEDLEFVPVGEHERILSIFVSGRFTKKASLPASPIQGTVDVAQATQANEASPKRAGTPTPVLGAGKRAGTPNKKESGATTEAPRNCCSLANGAYTNFNFSPELHRPFFSLRVPGLEGSHVTQPTEVLAGQASGNAGRSAAATASKAQVKESSATSPNSDPQLRVIPKGDEVNTDGTFKIEMFRRKLRIDPNTVEQVLSKRFQFQVHTVPDVSFMTSKYASTMAPAAVDLSATTSRKGAKGAPPSQVSGGAAGKNSKNKVQADPIELSQDPLTVPWLDANSILSHAFDLGNVLDKSSVDRVVLVQSEDSEPDRSLADSSNNAVSLRLGASNASLLTVQPCETRTEATKATLTRSHYKKTIAYTRTLPGFDNLIISIVCSEPLLSQNNVRRYLPMVVEVAQVTNLPILSANSLDLRHTMVPRQDELTFAPHQSKLHTAVSSTRSTQYKPVQVTFAGIRSHETFTTASHGHARDIDIKERFIIFLYKYTTLELYEHFFFRGICFALHDRDVLGDEPSESYAPPRVFGAADMSLKGAVKGETIFTASTQVVPRRESGSGNSSYSLVAADYISNCTTLKTKIRLLSPLPASHYITPRNLLSNFPLTGPFKSKYHLSRALFLLPYKSSSSQRVLQALMGVLIKFVKASESSGAIVEYRAPPPTRPSSPDEEILHAQRKTSSLQAKAKGGSAGMAGPGGKASKKSLDDKEPPSAAEEQRIFEEALPPIVEDATFMVPEGVSGFEIMDGCVRLICIEGYTYMLYQMVEVITRVVGDTDPSVRVLFNTDLAFPQRWYHSWPPLVKPMPHILGRFGVTMGSPLADGRLGSADTATPRPPSNGLEGADQSPKSKGDKKAAKPPKLTAAQKQAIADAAALETLRLEKEKEAAQAAEAEEAKRAALRGDRDELDSGGVGGRIRRIKLAMSLDDLAKQQKNFIKQYLSPEALSCIGKLNSLRSATSLSYAIDHGCFPSPHEIISLERVQGDTLELFDICGSNTFYTFEEGMVESAVSEAGQVQLAEKRSRQVRRELSTLEVLSNGLDSTHIGRMMNFIATPAHPSQLKRLPKLSNDYYPRHPHKNYMVVTSVDGQPLTFLCCYPVSPPSQILRYHCNAQVIGALERADSVEQVPILFILHFETVAKNGSDDRNPAYEEHLRREKRRADPIHFNKIMAQKKAYYLATHSAANKTSANKYGDSDEEDAIGFTDPPPYAPENAREKEELIENILVRNDYVTLNKDVPQTLRLWGRSVNDEPAKQRADEEALHGRCAKMYDSQSRRLVAIEEKVNASIRRPHHSRDFVSGNARTTDESHRHPKYIHPSDVADHSTYPTASGLPKPQPMSFSGGRTVIENKNLDELLPPLFKSKLLQQVAGMTKAEEAEAASARLKAENDEWKSKIVVDKTHFSVSTKLPRNKPLSSIDQYQSILEDEPMKETIKRSYAPPAPPSIRIAERLVPNERMEPNEIKHPERRTFYLAKSAPERAFYKDYPLVSTAEKIASPLYKHANE